MNKFTKAVQLNHNGYLKKKLGKDKVFKVVEPFVWYLNYEAKKEKVVVKKGFTTDFGSIPRFLWLFLNPTKYVSYILHDYLYAHKGKIRDEITTPATATQGRKKRSGIKFRMTEKKGGVSRLHADWILAQAMLVENREFGGLRYWLGFVEIAFVFLGVRIGGWAYWYFGEKEK